MGTGSVRRGRKKRKEEGVGERRRVENTNIKPEPLLLVELNGLFRALKENKNKNTMSPAEYQGKLGRNRLIHP